MKDHRNIEFSFGTIYMAHFAYSSYSLRLKFEEGAGTRIKFWGAPFCGRRVQSKVIITEWERAYIGFACCPILLSLSIIYV